MNLKRAGYLVAVAEHLSFTRAATGLFVAQFVLRRAARGAGGALRLALTRSGAVGRVGEAIAEFRRRRPEVEVVEHRGFSAVNLRQVVDGAADVGVVRQPVDAIQVPGVVLRELAGPAFRLAVGIASLDENPNPAVADSLGVVDQLSPPVAPARRDR